jgi:predicted ArsR family transcriptional regulator/TusA-related sulfurtransferase
VQAVSAERRDETSSGTTTVARALGSSTRAGIYEHLRAHGEPLTVRDVASTFELHPNVARTHLETLADAGLVSKGRRKHPGGGRPAKLYLAREDAAAQSPPADTTLPEGTSRAGVALLVRLMATLVDDAPRGAAHPGTGPARAHDVASAEGRRLVQALDSRGAAGSLKDAADVVVRALIETTPRAKVLKAGSDWVDVGGVRGTFGLLADARPELADALERGLLSGAFAAVGTPVALTDAGEAAGAGPVWRVRVAAPTAGRPAVAPAERVDTRGQPRESGVVRAMRAITVLRAGEALEVLTEGPGSPAAFARWADRAGHHLIGVDRATDPTGRPAIRLLIRKGGT